MNKNLKELKEISEDEKDFKSLRSQDFVLYYLIPVLEGFEKRLKGAEDKQNRKISGPIITKVGGTGPD